jgi:hypothetical protein
MRHYAVDCPGSHLRLACEEKTALVVPDSIPEAWQAEGMLRLRNFDQPGWLAR